MADNFPTDIGTHTYTTFGGPDIRAMFENTVIGALQGISYSVTREKAPMYVMGRADPVSISRGKRGVAGSLIFLTLDRHAIYEYMQKKSYTRKEGDTFVPDPLTPDPNITDDAKATPHYPDQMPPFDITLTAINEMGRAMAMRIHGVEILSNGSGVSIDDLNIEEQMTFICRGITGWRPVADTSSNLAGTVNNLNT